jgi:ADP-ribose pyrophosphatase
MPGEADPQAVAIRELREEAGVEASHWEKLGAVDLNNGITNDVEHLFLATGLQEGDNHPDPEEEIEVRWVALDEAVGMVLSGEISEVCSVAAILMAARRVPGL